MRDPLPPEVAAAFRAALNIKDGDNDFVPSGHGGSHPYLVHEFASAAANGAIRKSPSGMPPCICHGGAAHRSAQKDGEIVKVPDFGKIWE